MDKVGEVFDLDEAKLGAWKNEGTFDEFNSCMRKKYCLLNYNDPSKSKFAFAGVNSVDRLTGMIVQTMKEDREEGLRRFRMLFGRDKNVLIKKAKNVSCNTEKYAQKIIYTTDIKSNPMNVKKGHVDAIIEFTNTGYNWTYVKE